MGRRQGGHRDAVPQPAQRAARRFQSRAGVAPVQPWRLFLVQKVKRPSGRTQRVTRVQGVQELRPPLSPGAGTFQEPGWAVSSSSAHVRSTTYKARAAAAGAEPDLQPLLQPKPTWEAAFAGLTFPVIFWISFR